MADLRTDYKDDILDLTQNTQRKYRMITNDDGTVSFEDVTVYSQIGDSFGAADVNTITDALNNTEGSVRYNAETDMVQIKDAEGVWHDYASGGLVDLVLYKNGISYNTLKEYAYGHSEWSYNRYAPTVSLGTDSFTISINNSNGGGSVFFEESVDVTNYNKLRFECSTESPNIQLSISRTKKDSYEVERSLMIVSGVNELDISGLEGKYYVSFFLSGTKSLEGYSVELSR